MPDLAFGSGAAPNPFPIGGSWWMAEQDTAGPINQVNAEHGFVDPWPDGWTKIASRRDARLDIAFNTAVLMFARPIRLVPYDRRVMLGWQCRCNCERLIAYAAVKVLNQFVRLERSGPDGSAYRLHMVSSVNGCGTHLRWGAASGALLIVGGREEPTP